jgi:hypothetical protein
MRVLSDSSAASATIQLERRRHENFTWQSFRIFIDGVEVGRVKNGGQVSFSVEPGEHSIAVKAVLAFTGVAEVNIEAGETVRLWCAPRFQRIQVVVVGPRD